MCLRFGDFRGVWCLGWVGFGVFWVLFGVFWGVCGFYVTLLRILGYFGVFLCGFLGFGRGSDLGCFVFVLFAGSLLFCWRGFGGLYLGFWVLSGCLLLFMLSWVLVV